MNLEPSNEATSRANVWSRRSLLTGVVLGGVGGVIATTIGLRSRKASGGPESNQIPDLMRSLDHERFMRQAIVCARQAALLPFGAVIVQADQAKVIAEGFNRGSISPTYHGEIDAINRCAEQNPDIDWAGLVLYTTAEPCPMCQSAIEWAGIGMVVYGSSIPFLKSLGCPQIDVRAEEVAQRTPFHNCFVLGGILREECGFPVPSSQKMAHQAREVEIPTWPFERNDLLRRLLQTGWPVRFETVKSFTTQVR